MVFRTPSRPLLDVHVLTAQFPPNFLLPLRARLFNTSTPLVDETVPVKQPLPIKNGPHNPASDQFISIASQSALHDSPKHFPSESSERIDRSLNSSSRSSNQHFQSADLLSSLPASVIAPKPSGSVSESVKDLLPHLRAQTPHYITIHIHGRPYLVTAGDILRLPFLIHSVLPGDVLRLYRATHLGSRDFTLKGSPYVDESLFVCRARVMGVEAEPMRIKEKTKRRQRHVKTVRSKHKFTMLRVTEVTIKGAEVQEEGNVGTLLSREKDDNSKSSMEI